jgi:hydrogenase maturation protease
MVNPIRIVAWGNRGRCDDGVALALAERLQERFSDDPDVCVQQYHQLGPELAADLNECRLVVFLDAHVREDWPEVCVERVEPVECAAFGTHHCHPPVLLAMAKSMQFKVPPAWMVTMRGHCFEFGDTLSAATTAAMEQAERVVLDLVASGKAGLDTSPERKRAGLLEEGSERA